MENIISWVNKEKKWRTGIYGEKEICIPDLIKRSVEEEIETVKQISNNPNYELIPDIGNLVIEFL